jgi:hypothetical protein
MERMTWLQTATVFWLGGETISLRYLNVHWFNVVRQTEMHIVQALMPEPGAFELELVIEKQKKTHITRY